MKKCPHFPFMCDRNVCVKDDDRYTCGYDLLSLLDEEDVKLFEDDAKKNGYLAFPIELGLAMLRYTSPDVFLEDGKSISLRKILEDYPIYPHEITSGVEHEKYNLTASEFNTPCVLSRIIQKTNLDSKNVYARIGRVIHFLMNEQLDKLIHNETLLRMGAPAMDRRMYCERTLEFVHKDIIVHGHPDAMFEVKDMLGVFDNKRSMHVKHTYFTQETIYALAEDPNRERYLLVVATRPYGEIEFAERLPNLDVALIRRGGEVIRRTLKDIEESYIRQAELLRSDNPFKHVNKRNCVTSSGPCFNYEICKELYNLWRIERTELIDLLNDKYTEEVMVDKGFLERGKHILPKKLALPQDL